MSNVEKPARSIVRGQSIVLMAVVLLGTLVSAEGMLMEDQEELLVELHNRYRGLVQPSASAMLPLKWDENLKLVAEGYAAKCIWNHNPELEDTGENLFAGTGQLDLGQAMEKWFLERMDYNFSNNSCDEDKMCGHYTQMVWADSHRVGCAVHLCAQMEGLDWTEPSHFLVCNYYPPGNYEGERPYVEGEWCSQCPENFQRCENNLCAPEVEPTDAEAIEDPTPPSPSQEMDLSVLDATPETEQAPLPEQDQDSIQNPDQDQEDTVEQEAVVPPPATEIIPQEPESTAAPGTDRTDPEAETVDQTEEETVEETVEEAVEETVEETVEEIVEEAVEEAVEETVAEPEPDTEVETVVESVPDTAPDSAPEFGSKTEAGTRPEPEEELIPKQKEDPTGGPAGDSVVRTEQELKIPPIGGKAPPTHNLTPPPENRGQKLKEIMERHTRKKSTSGSVVVAGSWSVMFLWICLLCL